MLVPFRRLMHILLGPGVWRPKWCRQVVVSPRETRAVVDAAPSRAVVALTGKTRALVLK